MTDNNDLIVEEPVVDVDSENNNGVSNGVNNKAKYITIVISVAVSVLVYFFVFGDKKSDIVDPNQIVLDNQSTTKARTTIDNIDNVVSIDSNGSSLVVSDDFLKLPELPTLPDNVTQNIEKQIEEVRKEEVSDDMFTRDEVNEMINIKLKSFEDEMKRIKNESERLSKELAERKIEEENNKKNKKFASILGTGQAPVDSNTSNDGLPPGVAGDTVESLEEKKKEDERQLLIAQRKRVLQERQGASMFKMQGGGGGDGTSNTGDSIIITDKDSLDTVKDAPVSVVTTKTADLSRTLTQGKIIPAVLETAIDTDVQNQVRAVVSRDIYADMGKNILIPKGSKIIGTYQSVTSTTISRLDIVWTRIIRADGLNVNLSANSADKLGRGGVPGVLDNKYDQIIKNAFLSSVVTIATAALVDKMTDTVTTTTTNGTETSTTTSATNQSLIDATKDFGDEMKTVVDSLKEEKPTIRIAQGSKLNIIVNQDLVLPIYKQKKKKL